jgi:S-(hydroxymethyl)glutathione dehydrogenase/alcohol dehydrogenase
MKAAVLTQIGQPLSVEDVTPIQPGAQDVVVRVSASALCRTDASVRDGHLQYGLPILMGHEACGVVEWVGRDVQGLAPGDRVVTVSAPACGECAQCRSGRSHICVMSASVRTVPRARRADGTEATALYGLGSFAEQMTVHRASVVRVETQIPATHLALMGCGVTTGLGAVMRRADLPRGGSLAVIGCGTVGLAALQGGVIAGAAVRIGIDPNPGRRDLALRMGATHVFDPTANGTIEEVLAVTGGVDTCIDGVGEAETFQQAFAMTRRSGTVILVGVPHPGERYDLDALQFFLSEKRIGSALFGSAAVRTDIPKFVAFAESGRLDLGSLVTQVISLDEVNAGMAALTAGEVLRSVISLEH